ncbi:hypothetical protein [Helicobacter pylori]|uniref:hypothetical protein n=1 Tax=Helicobacter pylori TaxID=210 RepID=UPI00036D987F|nr:hypothetical protein [Helicobacter pylori]EQL69927.1 hypothetical protein N407_01055 [Helicobacter pylori FD662]
MGILWFILRLKKALLLGWLAFKGFKACLLQDFIAPYSQGVGQIRKHAIEA